MGKSSPPARRSGRSPTKKIALLENFAAQAVIAMENARLITETREALEQQTATAEVLQVINSSPGDLAPVFDAMLERATRLCDADAGVFCTYADACFLPAALARLPTNFRVPRADTTSPGNRHWRASRAASDIVHILDSASGDAYRSGDPGRRAIVQLGGARTQIAACRCARRTAPRLVYALAPRVRPFTDKQIALLQNFAAQAVIAMENARLLTETREALEQQTATAEVLQVINSSPGDLAPVFDAMLEKAMRLVRRDVRAVSTTYDGEHFRTVAHARSARGIRRISRGRRISPGQAAATGRIAGRRTLRSHRDATRKQAYPRGDPLARAFVELGRRAYSCRVPLRKDDGCSDDYRLPQRSAAVHRQADRAAREFRGAGGHRDGECAAD